MSFAKFPCELHGMGEFLEWSKLPGNEEKTWICKQCVEDGFELTKKQSPAFAYVLDLSKMTSTWVPIVSSKIELVNGTSEGWKCE